MRHNRDIELLLDQAEAQHRCACTHADARPLYDALKRRVKCGELISPYTGVFVRPEYWNLLNAIERTYAVIIALSILHPTWIFACINAATVHGLEHSFSLHGNSIFIVSSNGPGGSDDARLCRLYIRNPEPVTINGIQVTGLIRTLIDCALQYSFRDALAMFDSAARQGIRDEDILGMCDSIHTDTTRIRRLCTNMNPLSENGGESTARATMIELGFLTPELQVPFANPIPGKAPYRADFTWKLPGGHCVVAEYDGMGKYIMQSEFTRKTIQANVHDQLVRERDLKAAGVDTIVRFEYEDVIHPQRLANILSGAGIPKQR